MPVAVLRDDVRRQAGGGVGDVDLRVQRAGEAQVEPGTAEVDAGDRQRAVGNDAVRCIPAVDAQRRRPVDRVGSGAALVIGDVDRPRAVVGGGAGDLHRAAVARRGAVDRRAGERAAVAATDVARAHGLRQAPREARSAGWLRGRRGVALRGDRAHDHARAGGAACTGDVRRNRPGVGRRERGAGGDSGIGQWDLRREIAGGGGTRGAAIAAASAAGRERENNGKRKEIQSTHG